MEKQTQKLIIKNSLYTFSAILMFFFLMDAAGFIHNFALRLLNLVILGVGLHSTMRKIRTEFASPSYLKLLFSGMALSLITGLSLASFLFIYLANNPDFIIEVQQLEIQGKHLNQYSIPMLVFIEFFASGYLITFSILQWSKSKIKRKANKQVSNLEVS